VEVPSDCRWSETSSLEGTSAVSAEPRGWGSSMSRSGEIQLSAVTGTNAELANEGMYLAWLRTGLALAALGVAAERLLPAEGIIWARQLVGVSLILAGVLTAGSARWRWQTIDRAMRAGRRIPQPILGYVVAAIVVLDGLATIVLLLRADAG